MDKGHFEVSCPSCGEVLRIPDKFKGAKGSCKKCGSALIANPKEVLSEPSLVFTPAIDAADVSGEKSTRTRLLGLARKKRKSLIALSVLVLALASIGIYASPYIAFSSLRSALTDGDSARASKYIDYVTLRENLKLSLNAMIAESLLEEETNVFSAAGTLLAARMVETMIDGFVSPEGINRLIDVGKGAESAERSISQVSSEFEPSIIEQRHYEGMNRFVVRYSMPDDGTYSELVMSRSGVVGWKLTNLRSSEFGATGNDDLSSDDSTNFRIADDQGSLEESKEVPLTSIGEAPFGLRWGATEPELRSAGIRFSDSADMQSLKLLEAPSLPKNLSIADSYILVLDSAHGLQKIGMSSKRTEDDSYGFEGKKQYRDLKSTLTGRYGNPPSSYEETGKILWDDADEFYQCLDYDGCGEWASYWISPKSSDGTAAISLELKGVMRGVGFIELWYEGPAWSQIVDDREAETQKSDRDAL